MKKKYLLFSCMFLAFLFLPIKQVLAMPVGTILYRTSGDNKMYGYNANDLILAEKGKLAHIYSGHTAIYVGQEDGVDYIVEMQPKGAIKVPAKYFINEAQGEKLVGAKIPKNATPNQIAKAVLIAKNLAAKNLAYDFDFKYQKGPLNSQWTCVGLTEKVYESANISNPINLGSLVYDANNYAVDITPDGYDNSSVYNAAGDCFASDLEFSKIERKTNMVLPAPELLGFDIGIIKNDERFIFLPYTQYLQSSLKDVNVDISLSSSFKEPEVRGESPILGLVLKWSLINNPISTIKSLASKTTDVILAIKDKVFPDSAIALAEDSASYEVSGEISTSTKSTKSVSAKASSTKTSTVKLATTKASITKVAAIKKTSANNSGVKITVSKASSTASLGSTKTLSLSVTTPKTTTTAKLNTSNSSSISLTTTKASSSTKVVAEKPKTTVVTRTVAKPIIPAVATSSVPAPIENNASTTKPIALIAKIYSNGDDDWLEIVNTTDQDFDLAAAGYRLEKSKTGSDPTLIMRFGDETDGTYPGGTVIGAHSYYLIARDTASAEILAQADAIASKTTFSWTEDGYTLYLGTASISSDSDTDIVDKLGYGEATYYEKSPAVALKPGYALERKVSATSTIESMSTGGLEELWPRLFDSDNNSQDFILVPYDLEVINAENPISTSTSNTNSHLFVNPAGLDSEDLSQLWHFDECYGETAANELQISGLSPVDLKKSNKWTVGRWGCANALTTLASTTKATFSEPFDPNQSTINFYYQATGNFSITLKLGNTGNSSQQAYLELTPYFTNVYGFPGLEGRLSDVTWLSDSTWHQFSLVINRSGSYWSLYLDGKEVYSYQYSGIMPTFASLELGSLQNEIVAVDELSFWNRSLPPTELRSINLLNQPFNPYTWPEAQQEAKLEHYWSFDENTGLSVKDSVGTDNILVKLEQWDMEGRNNSGLNINQKVSTSLKSLNVTDFSMAFWWRNTSSPNEGRLRLMLKNNERNLMSLTPTIYNSTFGFNNDGGYLWEYGKYLFPDDKNWHHLALTYDSYRYLLSFYLDGELKMQNYFVKLQEDEKINLLEIVPENWPASIDELKIWSGTLTANQVIKEYEIFK